MIFLLFSLLIGLIRSERDCLPSGVCPCSLSSCNSPLIPILPSDLQSGNGLLYSTTQSGLRLEKKAIKVLSGKGTRYDGVVLNVDKTRRGQSIIGFGGAITDATSINVDTLSDELREKFIQGYFGKDGIGYTIVRIPIASCDFSTREYSYAEKEGDYELRSWKLVEEDEKKMRLTRRAIEISEEEDRRVKVFGSPWSAPAWMKSNGHMKGGGTLIKGCEDSYARYLTKFVEEYTSKGVPIWALTVQNEPSTGDDADYSFQTMYMPPEVQYQFVKNNLKPTLLKSKLARNVSIMIHDDFRGNLPIWADNVLKDKEIEKIVDGIAVHWYGDRHSDANNLSETKKRHPDKFILATEACVTDTHGVSMGNFTRAMMYTKDIIEDLTHSVSGWVDWNMALDPQGGPNWVHNFVDSPIIIDKEKQLFYKQPMFYAMGHFSRFMNPAAVQIHTETIQETNESLWHVAVQNMDKTTVVVIANTDNSIPITIQDGKMRMSVVLEPQSINTVIYKAAKKQL